ncbi:unnamed protein product [Cyclocybe aegerita]|uniref:GRIP domain-containing protein n=1 Tax=Cyclocybe aegerita TaxID=1973307 RepID=A0A8S0VSC1_CYCAE|nr:unnamed protein product [Cyclocybe aegerita]
MFSQLRNAVEQLAAGSSPSDTHSATLALTPRSQSFDLQSSHVVSPSQLADSAMSTLRKSLVSQRTSSTGTTTTQRANSPARPAENATSTTATTTPTARKSNLEERLRRATHSAIVGERPTARSSSPRSSSPTPSTVTRSTRVASPSPMARTRTPVPAKREASPAASRRGEPVLKPSTSRESKLGHPTELLLEKSVSGSPKPRTKRLEDVPPAATETPIDVSPKEVEKDALMDSIVDSQPQDVSPPPEEPKVDGVPSPMPAKPATEEPSRTTPTEVDASSEVEVKDEASEELAVEQTVEVEEIPIPSATPSPAPDTVTAVAENAVPAVPEEAPAVLVDTPAVPEQTPSGPTDDLPVLKERPVEVVQSEPSTETVEPNAPPAQIETSIPESKSEVVESNPPPVSMESESDAPEKQEEMVEAPAPTPSPPVVDRSAEVESLQERLKQVEQRFSDVSTSFKRLQAEKLAADSVLRESTPLESMNDAEALREFFANLKNKDQVFQDEIKRLNQKLEVQEDRFDELRETHRLESHSRSEEVKKLQTQLDETEALFQAAQRATSSVEEASQKDREEIERLHKEVESAKGLAKEEEEKRVKAISLLKTVRQKLVKAEKDKEDAIKEVAASKEREKGDKDKEMAERMNLQYEMDDLKAAHEKATANLKSQFEKDMANLRERYEQEIIVLKGQAELDLAAAKSAYAKELAAKTSQISTLENSLNNVSRDKNAFFDQLQLRQAEVESAQGHLESLEHQNTEFQFQLRESNDRLALLKEEYAELLRESESRSREPTTSADEVARMISATETKYEARIAEMKRNISVLEKERYESEADWSKKLKEKVKDLEEMKRVLGTATRSRENEENLIAELKADLARAQETSKALQHQAAELPILREQVQESQKSSKEQEQEFSVKITVLERQLEDHKTREVQLKQSNKTLRDELRKVQSSAALLERQRNPGVGYWTTRVAEGNGHTSAAIESRTSISSPSDSTSRASSPAPSTAASTKAEEEVNLEYLRNVILQFLEHKEMRPNLVRVLSIILHFTPQETRRLIAKV